ncbi:hypothetical protein CKK05_19720 [Acinetobacter baumannii]|nr:hypothetical protein [Acinetobacter baumannii]
MKLKSEFVKKA